jgi:hypothetical protein
MTLSNYTADELRAELERREKEPDWVSYVEAENAYFDEWYKDAQGTSQRDRIVGLIAAWPLMPETVALKAELARYKADLEVAPNPWIPHDGGPCPVADKKRQIQVKFRDGDTEYCEAGYYKSIWHHDDAGYDIIAYRLA